MHKSLLIVLVSMSIVSCNPKPPVLKSPCVAAMDVNGEIVENPCIRRAVNVHLFKI